MQSITTPMLPAVLATDDGLRTADGAPSQFPGASVTAIATDPAGLWALVDRQMLYRVAGDRAEPVATLDEPAGECLVVHADDVWVGGSEARLWRLRDVRLEPVESFASAPTHDEWHTPWGGPPDVFSMASDGTHLYVNVHVGGILRTTDGASWTPTIDLHDDVHQVVALPDGTVWAATGYRALAESRDFGATWQHHAEGLLATYATAVAAVPGGAVLAVAAGPGRRTSAVYRFDGTSFDRVSGIADDGVGAVGSRQLVAIDDRVLAARGGTLYESGDGGSTWRVAATNLGAVHEVALVDCVG